MEAFDETVTLWVIAGSPVASNVEQSHDFTPQARLELASIVQSEAESDTESGDPRTDESTGYGVRCDVRKWCSFRSAGESIGVGKGVLVHVREANRDTIGHWGVAERYSEEAVFYSKLNEATLILLSISGYFFLLQVHPPCE